MGLQGTEENEHFDKKGEDGSGSLKTKLPRAKRVVSRKPWPEQERAERSRALEMWSWIAAQVDSSSSAFVRRLEGCEGEALQTLLLDTFAGKATATLVKRGYSMLRYLAWSKPRAAAAIPFKEQAVYDYVTWTREEGCGATSAQSFLEAIPFTASLLELPWPEEVMASNRVKGAALMLFDRKRLTKQAVGFSPEVLKLLENGVVCAQKLEDRVHCGDFCFAIHARVRWDDAARIDLEPSLDLDGRGNGFVETGAYKVKTGSALRRRRRLLPTVASALGLAQGSWAVNWLESRLEAGLDAATDGCLFCLHQPDGFFTSAKMESSDAVLWLVPYLIENGVSAEEACSYTSHSCKATLLSWLAKAGVHKDIRRLLGGHVERDDVSMLTYSRDALAGPLQWLEALYRAVRDKRFCPTATRSGRWMCGPRQLLLDEVNDEELPDAPDQDSEVDSSVAGSEKLPDYAGSLDGAEASLDNCMETLATAADVPGIEGEEPSLIGRIYRHRESGKVHFAAEDLSGNRFLCGRPITPVYDLVQGRSPAHWARCLGPYGCASLWEQALEKQSS